MSNLNSLLDLLTSTQQAKEATLNALYDAASPMLCFGRHASACNGLTWGYYGGQVGSHAVANGSITLTANATNYLYADPATGAMSVNTAGVPAGSVPLYTVITGSSTVVSYTDLRSFAPSASLGVNAVANEDSGVGLYDAAASTAAVLRFKTLVATSSVTLTDQGASIRVDYTSGTVTGGTNEGAGAPLLDATNSSATTLVTKTLVAGSGIALRDYGANGIVLALAGGLPDVAWASALVIAPSTLNAKGLSVVNPSGAQADLQQYPLFGMNDLVPLLANFSWINQGTASAVQQPWGISVFAPKVAGADSVAALMMSAPAPPYQVIARLRTQPLNVNYQGVGLCWADSASGKLQSFGPAYASGRQTRLINWNSPTSYNADQASQVRWLAYPEWLRLQDDGTTRFCDVSSDGQTWVTLFSLARTTFLTPNQVGIFLNPNGGDLMLSLASWYAGP